MTINGYKYWSKLRPVGPFTYPSDARLLGFYNYESRTEYHGKMVWGWMRLDRELTKEEQDQYDLVPEEN